MKNDDEIHELAIEHWNYVKNVLINAESNINHKILDIIGFHYITALKHGYKHGVDEKDSELKEEMADMKEVILQLKEIIKVIRER